MIDGLKSMDAVPDFVAKADWPTARLWQIARIRSEKKRPDLPLLSVFLGRGVITYGEGGRQVHKPGQDLSVYQVVHVGDLVLNNQQAWRGSVGVSKYQGIISPAYVVLSLSEVFNPRFADYLFQSPAMVAQFVTSSKGVGDIQRDIHTPLLKNVKVPIPTLDEQKAMVRFLDWKTGGIERFIRTKKKLIALLNEQKQAIIHRAVTRGLDPNVRLKPSGVLWLGDIPEHWDFLRVKQCAYKISKGTTPSTEGREILESGPVRFIKAENISGGNIVEHPLCFIDEQTNKILLRSQLKQHDILFVIAGATLGKIAVVANDVLPANTNQAVSFIRPNKRLFPAYLALWLQSPRIKEQIWLNAVQSAQPNLSMADLGNFAVPLPPLFEQTEIIGFLEAETEPINTAIARTDREISLLREYRTRLVADVVTGQLDVRDAVRHLPSHMDEAEPLADSDELTDEIELDGDEGSDE